MDLEMRDCNTCGFRYQPTGRNQKTCGACRKRGKEAARRRRIVARKCVICERAFTPGRRGRVPLCCSKSCLDERTRMRKQARFHNDPVYREKLRATNVAASRKWRKKQRKAKK